MTQTVLAQGVAYVFSQLLSSTDMLFFFCLEIGYADIVLPSDSLLSASSYLVPFHYVFYFVS